MINDKLGRTEEPNLQDGINWLMNDLSMVPNGIIDKIAEYLETLNYNTSIHNNEISFKGNYNDFMLFLNEDLSAKLNLYTHAAPEFSELYLKKMASTPNLEHRIKRIIEADNENVFSVDIPPMTAETYQEQLEYYIKLLHDYEFDLFFIL